MKKIIVIIVAFLILVSLTRYYYREAQTQKIKAENYRHNNNILLDKVKGLYNEKITLERQNETLAKAAAKDKNYFDWHFDISHTAVIKQLRQK